MTCEFYVTIGKDGDEQLYRRTILLNGCSEDDLSALYDCYVGEAESSSGVTLEERGGMTGLVRVGTADNTRKNREIRNSDSLTLEAVFPDGIVIDLGEAD